MPRAHVVVRPVAIVEVDLGGHVVGIVVKVQHCRKCSQGITVGLGKIGRRGVLQHFDIRSRRTIGLLDIHIDMLDKIDFLGIDLVVGFHEMLVQFFAHVVNPVILAVVKHHYLAASLIVDRSPFQKAYRHRVCQVITDKAVAVIAQNKSLELLRVRACIEQRVLQPSILILLAHHDGYGFLNLVTAIAAHNGNPRINLEGLGLRRTSLGKVFYMHREFHIFPEFCRLARIGLAGKRSDIVRIKYGRHAQGNHRHPDFPFAHKVRLRLFRDHLCPDEFRTAGNGIRCHGMRKFGFGRSLRRFRAVKGTANNPALCGDRRIYF